MKNIFIVLFLLFLTSCGNSDDKAGVIEETGDIVDGYIDTLEGSITDAKEARKLIDDRYEKISID